MKIRFQSIEGFVNLEFVFLQNVFMHWIPLFQNRCFRNTHGVSKIQVVQSIHIIQAILSFVTLKYLLY